MTCLRPAGRVRFAHHVAAQPGDLRCSSRLRPRRVAAAEALFQNAQRMKANKAICIFPRGDQVSAQMGADTSESLVVEPWRDRREQGFGRRKTKFEIRHRRREHRDVGLRNQSQVASNREAAGFGRHAKPSNNGSMTPKLTAGRARNVAAADPPLGTPSRAAQATSLTGRAPGRWAAASTRLTSRA